MQRFYYRSRQLARENKEGITKEMKYKFEVNEKAVGKARPRYNPKAHKMYTPIKTSNFEEKIKNAFLQKYNVQTELSEKPFDAIIKVWFEPVKSTSKKKRENLLYGPCDKKPDCDNIAKSVLDALNGLAYKDDKQVSYLSVEKLYGPENKIEIDLEEINK